MFRKVLIANRGEIAVRVARTCRRMGIKTVAVYSEPDQASKHTYIMDEAYPIGLGPPSQSYLNIPKIVEVATKSGSDAVHPGYGFLAENAYFAKAVEEVGLVFIGPRAKALGGIASKLEAKKRVADAGVPVTPGPTKELQSTEHAEEEARRIGYPVLVKAAYGGGGRGMRIVQKPSDLRRMMEIASSEAKGGFGRSGLYLEKYLEAPRHIEVQVVIDPHGRKVHLGERECSMQRRYQKILEETPSPVLKGRERDNLCELGLKAALALGYENAGTVEFVRSSTGELYFLELNKRIQVEHLVTELVTHVDIVEQQLRIASGEGLALSQDEIVSTGWALNCRINAEDPGNGFAPSPGRITRYIPPTPQWVRVDTALYDGSIVPQYYDSLIAKLSTYAMTRDRAIEWMRFALDEMVIEGVKTTIPLHRAIMDDPDFVKGDYNTQTLERVLLEWRPTVNVSDEEAVAAYLALRGVGRTRLTGLAVEEEQLGRWRQTVRPTEPMSRQPLYVEGV